MSVVVAVRADDTSAGACLDSLRLQLSDVPDRKAEVIVVGPNGNDESWIRVVTPSGDLHTPELWAAGIAVARGSIVGLLAASVVPDPDWIELTLRAHEDGTAAVGGPIEPGGGLGLVDWAVFFCRYAPFCLPLVSGPIEVPGDNASYRMDVLSAYEAAYADGFWEPFVHRLMRTDGHQVSMRSDRIVRFHSGARLITFSRQRFAHGRVNGARRAALETSRARAIGIVTAPAVPVVMTTRVVRTVLARRRHRAQLIAAIPLVFWFFSCWAVGEMIGRVGGAGPTTK